MKGPLCLSPASWRSWPARPATPLEERDTELVCTGQDCGLAYPVRDGIPVLLVDEACRPE
ncbi:Trm112 family protein [Streptomyces thermocarboxydus]